MAALGRRQPLVGGGEAGCLEEPTRECIEPMRVEVHRAMREASSTRLLEMLSDRFGAFEAIANSSIKLSLLSG